MRRVVEQGDRLATPPRSRIHHLADFGNAAGQAICMDANDDRDILVRGQQRFQICRRDGQVVLDLGKHRHAPGIHHGLRRGHESKTRENHFLPGLQPQSL
jgi:hypothetical protein